MGQSSGKALPKTMPGTSTSDIKSGTGEEEKEEAGKNDSAPSKRTLTPRKQERTQGKPHTGADMGQSSGKASPKTMPATSTSDIKTGTGEKEKEEAGKTDSAPSKKQKKSIEWKTPVLKFLKKLTIQYLVGFCHLAVGFIFNLVAFVTTEWVVSNAGDYGLFTDNHDWRYLTIPFVLSLLLGVVPIAVSTYYLVVVGLGKDPYHKIPFCVAIFTIIVVFLNVFGMIMAFQVLDSHETLGFSAILDIIGTFCLLIGGVVLIVPIDTCITDNKVGPEKSSPDEVSQ